MAGLSPLTRGNRAHGQRLDATEGPIPAHAGQPGAAVECASCARAYPRSRGATIQSPASSVPTPGLSPLTRGNLLQHGDALLDEGPIPAHAGQPQSPRPPPETARAYPRSRGATQRAGHVTGDQRGLSPLTRGNPSRPGRRQKLRGPIPAHAGQPSAQGMSQAISGAYPRSRGATRAQASELRRAYGLSPLTRGNQAAAIWQGLADGPIPAHAGQPAARCRPRPWSRAYPRSRGATPAGHRDRGNAEGLSPLTRGNLSHPTRCQTRENFKTHSKF